MSTKQKVVTDKGVKSPLFSQAIIHGNTVYCSGNIGMDLEKSKPIEGTVYDRTKQALKIIEAVLTEAGSSLQNILKVNIYLTSMDDYAAMNKAYLEVIPHPLPARTCVCVKELPFKTDVEIECTAHLNGHSKL